MNWPTIHVSHAHDYDNADNKEIRHEFPLQAQQLSAGVHRSPWTCPALHHPRPEATAPTIRLRAVVQRWERRGRQAEQHPHHPVSHAHGTLRHQHVSLCLFRPFLSRRRRHYFRWQWRGQYLFSLYFYTCTFRKKNAIWCPTPRPHPPPKKKHKKKKQKKKKLIINSWFAIKLPWRHCQLKPKYSFGKWWKWKISLMGIVHKSSMSSQSPVNIFVRNHQFS